MYLSPCLSIYAGMKLRTLYRRACLSSHATPVQEQASQVAKAQAEAASQAGTTSALQQMCLQLHSTAADEAAAKKAALEQV